MGAVPLARLFIPSPCFFVPSIENVDCVPFPVATGVICTSTQQQSSVRELFLSFVSLLLIDDEVEAVVVWFVLFCNAEARMNEGVPYSHLRQMAPVSLHLENLQLLMALFRVFFLYRLRRL